MSRQRRRAVAGASAPTFRSRLSGGARVLVLRSRRAPSLVLGVSHPRGSGCFLRVTLPGRLAGRPAAPETVRKCPLGRTLLGSRGCSSGATMQAARLGTLTFPYRFALVHPRAHCATAWRGATRSARFSIADSWLSRSSGRKGRSGEGRLLGRHPDSWRPPRGVQSRRRDGAALGPRENDLGTGGAVVPSFRVEAERRGEDCQVPSRRSCLSRRDGAAGPEWRLAPCASTLALGQRLGQLVAAGFARLSVSEPRAPECAFTLQCSNTRQFRGLPQGRSKCERSSPRSNLPRVAPGGTRGVALLHPGLRAVWLSEDAASWQPSHETAAPMERPVHQWWCEGGPLCLCGAGVRVCEREARGSGLGARGSRDAEDERSRTARETRAESQSGSASHTHRGSR